MFAGRHNGTHLVDLPEGVWVRVYALLCTLLHTDLKRDPYKALICKPIAELLHPERQLDLDLIYRNQINYCEIFEDPHTQL